MSATLRDKSPMLVKASSSVASNVQDAVRWQPCAETIFKRSHEQFKLWSAQALGYMLGAAVQRRIHGAEQLANDLNMLSTAGLSRLLLAPKVSCRLGSGLEHGLDAHIAYLLQCVQVEHLRDGATTSIQKGSWSALGDFYAGFAPLPPFFSDLLIPVNLHDRTLHAYQSQHFGPCIPLDLCSLDCVDGDGFAELGKPRRPEITAEELKRLTKVLDAAFDLIALADTSLELLVRIYMRAGVVRNMQDSGFGSSSTLSYPGRTLLINPLSQGVTSEMLAETLVHEAIHSFIYELEALQWWTRNDTACTLRSPWSGNILTLHAFVHACFVWFGLAHFWLRLSAKELLPATIVKPKLYRCLVGFLGSSLPDVLLPFSPKLHEGIIDTVASIQGEMNGLLR